MSAIATTLDIRRAIADQGYCVVSADALRIPEDLRQAWLSLQIDYAVLPADDYLPGGGKYRFRRYGRFAFSPRRDELSRLPHDDYFQSADINRVTGGTVRKFAPLLETSFDNDFLRELIRFDFRQFPLDKELLEADWEVQAHLIRVRAHSGESGQPTPEGIHRDGARFVAVHLAELANAQGGAVCIYADDRELLTTFRLRRELDSYFLDDTRLWHAAEPIRPRDEAHRALRSILTFDFHCPAGRSSRIDL